MFPTPFQLTKPQPGSIRSLTQDIKPFLNNIHFQYKNPLPFETETFSIPTNPLVRKHSDSYLYYIRYRTLDISTTQILFKYFSTLFKILVLEQDVFVLHI